MGRTARSRKGIEGRGPDSRTEAMSISSSCSEHYRAIALSFHERAAGTSDIQLRHAYRYVAARYERLAKLAEADDRLRGYHSLH